MTLDEIKKINKENCPRFSSFAKDQLPMPGVKKRLDAIINREITVLDYRLRHSSKREGTECLQLQFMLDDEVCVLFTGSGVLIHQIKECAAYIPFDTVIVKVDRYYSFS